MTTDEESRVTALLRRAGRMPEAPPARVWRSIEDELDAFRPPRAVRPGRRRARADRRRVAPLALAAACGALVTYVGSQLLPGTTGAPVDRAGTVVASGELGPVPGEGRVGQAQVLSRDHEQVLRVVLDELPDPQNGYLEVWLLRPDVSGLVTLGVLDETEEEFVLPAGLDLSEYPVVDISVEQLDGDPGHGGHSLVRGQVR